MRIKEQLRRERAEYFNMSAWSKHKRGPLEPSDARFDLYFPYSNRIKPALDICGKYEIMQEIPKDVRIITTAFATCYHGLPGAQPAFAEFLSGITNQEFKDSRVDNKKFHNLLKETNQKGKIKKPRLIPILEHFCKIGFMPASDKDTIVKAIVNRGTKKSTSHVYISCDPWDMFRMGVGGGSLGSCMNVVSSKWAHVTRCPSNLTDSSMLVAFVEDESNYRKVGGMMSRMIARVLHIPGEYGVVLDRLYGEPKLRSAIESATKLAAKRAGIRYLKFKSYLYEAKSNQRIRNNGRELIGFTGLDRYHYKEPWLDNARTSTGNGFVDTKIKGIGKQKSASFRVVIAEEEGNEKT